MTPDEFDDLNPLPRLLMGPGPINADPRVLRAMSAPLLGQFDPQFRDYMAQTSTLYRGVFQTNNRWTLVVDGTARSAIEAALVSLIEPGDRVLVPIFGRFGHLKVEIARRCGAEVRGVEIEWGTVFAPERLEAEVKAFRPKLVAVSHGDTSTTMAQPLAELGRICRAQGALLYVDATATLGGMDLPVDAWQLDVVSAGLQKCLGGPSGNAPLTFNDRAAALVERRCAGCHAERPSFQGFAQPPLGVMLDSPERIRQHAAAIHKQSVAAKAMPPGNLTAMTEDERAVLARWFSAGARGD